MAPEESKTKKRKGGVDAEPKPKKQKKADDAVAPKKTSKALKSAVAPVDAFEIPKKISRKRTADPIAAATDEAVEAKLKKSKKNKSAVIEAKQDEAPAQTDKPKKSKKAKAAVEELATETPAEVAANGIETKVKKSKKSKAVIQDEGASTEPAEVSSSADGKTKKASKKLKLLKDSPPPAEEEDGDDQTTALLAGFDDSDDESEAGEVEGEGLQIDGASNELAKSLAKDLKKAAEDDETPGVIYIGHVPHGFYEHQMKDYFSQFGTVTRLRLSRNKKTGRSKHRAFVEFASAAVAKIVANTMNNYLMFNHILRVAVIPPEQVHPNMFKGANKRYKPVPHNKIERAALEKGADRETWEKRITREEKKRKGQGKKMKEIFDYEYEAPELKAVDTVPVKPKAIEAADGVDGTDEEPKQIDAVTSAAAGPGSLIVTEKVKVKKSKKDAKVKTDAAPAVTEETIIAEITKPVKPKKARDAKARTDGDITVKKTVITETVKPVKEKKEKKSKKEAHADDAEQPVKEKKRKVKASGEEGAKPKVKKAKASA